MRGAGRFGQFGEEVREISMWLETIRLCAFHQGVQACARLGAGDGVTEEPALAADDERADRVLGTVGIERDLRVIEEVREFRPLRECVVDGFAKCTLRQDQIHHAIAPGFELGQDERRALAPNAQALFGGGRFELALDTVELADEIEGDLRMAILVRIGSQSVFVRARSNRRG